MVPRHEGGVEPPRPGLWNPDWHRYSRRGNWSERRI